MFDKIHQRLLPEPAMQEDPLDQATARARPSTKRPDRERCAGFTGRWRCISPICSICRAPTSPRRPAGGGAAAPDQRAQSAASRTSRRRTARSRRCPRASASRLWTLRDAAVQAHRRSREGAGGSDRSRRDRGAARGRSTSRLVKSGSCPRCRQAERVLGSDLARSWFWRAVRPWPCAVRVRAWRGLAPWRAQREQEDVLALGLCHATSFSRPPLGAPARPRPAARSALPRPSRITSSASTRAIAGHRVAEDHRREAAGDQHGATSARAAPSALVAPPGPPRLLGLPPGTGCRAPSSASRKRLADNDRKSSRSWCCSA